MVRKIGRRRYPMRRRMRRRFPRRSLNSQSRVYSFKRTVALPPWEWTTAEDQQASNVLSNVVTGGYFWQGYYKFKLADLPDYSDFTNLYERYKIKGVKLKFIPVHGTDSDVSGGLSGGNITTLALAINREPKESTLDNPTFDSILQQQDAKVYTSHKPFNVYIPYPKFGAPAGGVTLAQEKGGWLNTKHSTVSHYGLDYSFEQIEQALPTSFRVYATYYLKFANPL